MRNEITPDDVLMNGRKVGKVQQLRHHQPHSLEHRITAVIEITDPELCAFLRDGSAVNFSYTPDPARPAVPDPAPAALAKAQSHFRRAEALYAVADNSSANESPSSRSHRIFLADSHVKAAKLLLEHPEAAGPAETVTVKPEDPFAPLWPVSLDSKVTIRTNSGVVAQYVLMSRSGDRRWMALDAPTSGYVSFPDTPEYRNRFTLVSVDRIG